jgi:hypothetical protein
VTRDGSWEILGQSRESSDESRNPDSGIRILPATLGAWGQPRISCE